MKNNFEASNKKRKIITSYDSSAHFYDNRYKLIQEEKFLKALEKFLLTEKNVLDIACGTGLLFEFIIKHERDQRISNYNYVAIDISLNMLLRFKLKLPKLNDRPRVALILSDMENLPFRDNIFNLIFCFTSFQNLLTCNQGIRELLRVALNNSDLIFSILKKKLNLSTLIALLKPKLKNIDILNEELIEDVIIQGKISKS